MARDDFVHLHTHSHYSLLEALPKIPDLVAAAKRDGQSALALTDNGNLYGAIEFYKECKKEGLKPIIGVDFFVAPRTRHDKEHRVDDVSGRLVLIAEDERGYRNLLQLVSKSYLEGFFRTPRIDRELIEAHAEGLIAILPSYGGEAAYALRHENPDRAAQTLDWYRGVYGANCFVEITRHPEIDGHDERMAALAALAQGRGVPLVAAHDVYYLHEEDGLACDLVNKIRTASVLERDGGEYRMRDFSFKSRTQMAERFADLPEAIANAADIARRSTLELSLGKAIFPDFPIPRGSSADKELRALALRGIPERGLEETPDLSARIEHELGIIAQKGYASYFLIVADLLRFARSQGIYTNTRGSAAGSLVSYLCGITTVDPIKFQMPFERFLNPERPSAPDIDMDIADSRRDELIEYARRTYGETHVVQIGTFGTMLARAAVRDVARALGHSYGTGDRIAKLIPFGKQGFPVTIQSALESTPELAEAYRSDADAREIIDLARKVEGNARHVGVHAAGVVISPEPVTHYVPIQLDPKGGKTITQYDMYSIADEYGGVGLLKFDFLGLKNLSVLADSVKRVRSRLGTEVDLERIPLDDKKVYEMLARGETLGVFQMAGSGMTSYLKDLRPTVVHDLNAMVALYRPGPMAFIPEYIERKRNPARVRYLDPRLEHILKPTHGVLIYQDDVMTIAVELAGYSWGEADKLRKAMGKKIPAEMQAQKDRFQKGCVERGMAAPSAQKLWEQIETFAAYGFNKSHAASYGNLAYKTAYMKANFPVDYMAAVLTADAGDVEKIADIIAECRRMGITVLPPSVNESRGTFTVIDDTSNPSEQAKTIRFGLYSIKNFGTGVANTIITERDAKGAYKDLGDFLSRVTDKNLNKKTLESLIQCGALDEWGERNALLAHIETLLSFHREHTRAPSDQVSLFGGGERPKARIELSAGGVEAASLEERLRWEKELLGFYISGHPLDRHKEKLARAKDIKHTKERLRGVETVIGGYIESVQTILTRSGERMGFLRLSDYSDSIEVVAFPRVLKEHGELLASGSCILLKGKVSERNGQASFVAEKVKSL
ncbi:DNA polymerase III subunit alpha [Candidatus Kaiserbacteria bacterium CG10_big_fil_rev_8_21_14_0_10_59_10]|uniref:DNA polymerase III subunit alpha n=1 Tax=Candidatus Kaiserbacteria bacterium CG10_big_fil_rev_8_21_14_0_10_59_10 TaxID=1974612 RepID=A0A2H0U6T4_9BACT|nr:MAG: DNA polymerase III subunit alpha [Candidatus Kaiserbacteria bacterium CG10_big_fil_rev_8_21_14_0_10_59_10]